MGLNEKKLSSEDFSGKNVKALPDKPSEMGMTAQQLKAAFDKSGEEVIAGRINAIIDVLTGSSGAGEIGTQSGESVEEALARCLAGNGIRQIRIAQSGVLEYSPDGVNWMTPATGGGMSGNYDAGAFFSSQILQLKRGEQVDLPALQPGEPAFCTDSGRLYLGNGETNVVVGASIWGVGEIGESDWEGEEAPFLAVVTPPARDRRYCEVRPNYALLSDEQMEELLACGIVEKTNTASTVTLRAMYQKPEFAVPLEFWYHD